MAVAVLHAGPGNFEPASAGNVRPGCQRLVVNILSLQRILFAASDQLPETHGLSAHSTCNGHHSHRRGLTPDMLELRAGMPLGCPGRSLQEALAPQAVWTGPASTFATSGAQLTSCGGNAYGTMHTTACKATWSVIVPQTVSSLSMRRQRPRAELELCMNTRSYLARLLPARQVQSSPLGAAAPAARQPSDSKH